MRDYLATASQHNSKQKETKTTQIIETELFKEVEENDNEKEKYSLKKVPLTLQEMRKL